MIVVLYTKLVMWFHSLYWLFWMKENSSIHFLQHIVARFAIPPFHLFNSASYIIPLIYHKPSIFNAAQNYMWKVYFSLYFFYVGFQSTYLLEKYANHLYGIVLCMNINNSTYKEADFLSNLIWAFDLCIPKIVFHVWM